MANGETTVRFQLWAVLGFLVLLGGIIAGYILTVQAEDRAEQQKTKQEVVVMKEQYRNINEKLDKLVTATEKINDAFIDHRIKTEKQRVTLRGKE